MRSNAIVFSMLCGLLGWSARGQVTTSSIYGTVTDSTAGVVAGATVTLTNAGTGAEAAKVTDPDGSFVFDFVRVGTYRLKISAPGFKALEASDIDLQAGTSLRRTFTLDVGSVNETVSVQGTAPLVNAVSA